MAARDVLSVQTETDLKTNFIEVIFDDMSTGGTVAMDGSGATLTDKSTAKLKLLLTTPGYDSSAAVDSLARNTVIYGTHRRRLEYPNHANGDESASGGDLIVRYVPDEELFSTDSLIEADCEAGLANDGSASNQTLGIVPGNNCTLTPPTAFMQWDVVGFQRVTTDFRLAVIARHGFGVAAVKLTAVGGTSAHSQEFTVSTPTKRQRTGSKLYNDCFEATIPLSGFTQGETINCRARVYPKLGGASQVYDTDSFTGSEWRGRGPITMTCDKTGALIKYAVVDPVSGNDGTGVGSSTLATAEASPFANPHAAYHVAGVNVIYLKNTGDVTAVGGNTSNATSLGYWREMLPHPSNVGTTTVVMAASNRSYQAPRLKIQGIRLRKASGSAWLDGDTANYLWLDQCAWDDNGVGAPTVGPGYQSLATYVTDCTGLSNSLWSISHFSTAHVAYLFDGCTWTEATAGSGSTTAWYKFVCNDCTGAVALHARVAGNPAGSQFGCLIENNRILDMNATGDNCVQVGGAATTNDVTIGFSVTGNVFNKTGATSATVLIQGDGTTSVADHVIYAHNTVLADSAADSRGRTNMAYNDSGSTRYARTNFRQVGNVLSHWNCKQDRFPTEDGARTGGWPVSHGINCEGNGYEDTLFPGDYDGYGNDITASFTVRNRAGNNYQHLPASFAYRRLPVGKRMQSVDLFGNEIRNDGYGDLGAVQPPRRHRHMTLLGVGG